MFTKKKKDWELAEAAATPESVFEARRRFVKAMGLGVIAGGAGAAGLHFGTRTRLIDTPAIAATTNPDFADPGRQQTPAQSVFRFTNFYEFGIDKRSPTRVCKNFKLDPWTLEINGLVNKPLKLTIDDIKKLDVEQRVYRFRCVEAWAMTVPWTGVPLATLIKMADPKPEAKFASLTSFYDTTQAPRQADPWAPWPYREGVRLDEAMNPLAFAAIGLYGKMLQPQNGAPFRVVFPWKYGFKGPKSVVQISLTNSRPSTFWNTLQPEEYGFYGNVNPDKPHPRWSQKWEALIGTWAKRIRTQKYNGYGDWVAKMYGNDE